jgi:hypothetical protein
MEIRKWHVCFGSVIWPSANSIKEQEGKVMAVWFW